MVFIESAVFVLLFIIRLRFPNKESIATTIRRRYDSNTVKALRKYEKTHFRYKKTQLDIDFLNNCKNLKLLPNFLQFRIPNKHLRTSEAYKQCQERLLREELEKKTSDLNAYTKKLTAAKNDLKMILSWLDFAHTCSIVISGNDKRLHQIQLKHEEKLSSLLSIKECSNIDPDLVIHNFSNLELSEEEKSLLSKGLNYSLLPKKLNYADYCVNYELLFRDIKLLKGIKQENIDSIRSFLKNAAISSCRDYNDKKHHPNNLTKDEFNALKQLASNNDIIVQKADKGNAIVLINREVYKSRMKEILSDTSKFSPISMNNKELQYIKKQEDRIREVIDNLYKSNKILKHQHDKMYPIGSRPGILYGLGKVHKPLIDGHPKFRPILSAIGTSTYNLAKFLNPILCEITTNEYTVSNSFAFAREIRDQDSTLYMASMDVDSLFTSIPLDETIDICINQLFQDKDTVSNLTKDDLKQLLQIATNESLFIFDDQFYKQVDGVAMGSPLGPHFANAFLCYYEKQWLEDCPIEFAPVYYRRYVDDIFVLFKSPEHVQLFADYLNTKHANISFTWEEEVNGVLPFLDIEVKHEDLQFSTTVYHKPTFTGLYTHYDSQIPMCYKIGLILTLLYRYFHLCSTYLSFDIQVQYLKKILVKNRYPVFLIDKCIKRFLDKNVQVIEPVAAQPKEQLYLVLPFLGKQSLLLKKKLTNAVKRDLPNCSMRVIFKCQSKISSVLSFKDKIPFRLQSHVVYKFKCHSCNAVYIGLCWRHVGVRWWEHMGTSWRTGKPEKGVQSDIKDHCKECTPANIDDFEIVAREEDNFKLRIKESLLIQRHGPNLNKDKYSTPLMLF